MALSVSVVDAVAVWAAVRGRFKGRRDTVVDGAANGGVEEDEGAVGAGEGEEEVGAAGVGAGDGEACLLLLR